jgi:phage/plasmid-like protein (TIGR03299 family)
VLVRLDEPITLPGDDSTTYPYLAITNRHDGKGACSLRTTAVRIVCQNTFNMAEMEGLRTGANPRVPAQHQVAGPRIAEVREAVTGARKEMQAWKNLATELLGVPSPPRQRELFVTAFIPGAAAGSGPPSGCWATCTRRSRSCGSCSCRPHNEPVIHTAYGLVQAAGEYLDHVRTARTWETRLNRNLMKPEPFEAQGR